MTKKKLSSSKARKYAVRVEQHSHLDIFVKTEAGNIALDVELVIERDGPGIERSEDGVRQWREWTGSQWRTFTKFKSGRTTAVLAVAERR